MDKTSESQLPLYKTQMLSTMSSKGLESKGTALNIDQYSSLYHFY